MKAILFNIFGGITRTDDVANGIVTATKQNPLKVPIVIRLTGTNEEIALKILKENGFSAMTDMDEAVKKAVALATGRKGRVSIFIDKNTHAHRAGHHRPRRVVPHEADDRVRHAGRRRRHAREGRPEVRGQGADLQHRRRGGEGPGANATVIYVPPPFAADAMMEAADAGISFIVCITEGVPVLDMTRVYPFVKEKGARLLGPNCPGLISPGKSKVGIIPGRICTPGPIGLVSRSGTLTYEVVYPADARRTSVRRRASASAAIRSTARTSSTASRRSRRIRTRRRSCMIGEIGGTDEQEAAAFVKEKMTKPVVGFIAGQTAPPGRRMGHAGAIISGSAGTAAEKMQAFEEDGMGVAKRPIDVVDLLKRANART